MPKVCQEVFERTVVYNQVSRKEYIAGVSEHNFYKKDIDVSYEDKLIEIKVLSFYSNLEVNLNTNIYKDGKIIGKVYKTEIDSEGDALYFLNPEYKLTQIDDDSKSFLEKYNTAKENAKTKKELDILRKMEKEYQNKDVEYIKYKEKIRKEMDEFIEEIRLKNKKIDELIQENNDFKKKFIEKVIDVVKNTTLIERISIKNLISIIEELKLEGKK